MSSAQKIACAIKTALAVDGINVIMNNGAAAGQIVFHAHLHVIARFAAGSNTSRHEELGIVASKIREALL